MRRPHEPKAATVEGTPVLPVPLADFLSKSIIGIRELIGGRRIGGPERIAERHLRLQGRRRRGVCRRLLDAVRGASQDLARR